MSRFRKYERLTSRKLIQELFSKGQSFLSYPFRVTFMEIENQNQIVPSVVLHVSKRNHKKAVTRNRIKRLMREAYRFNKEELYNYLKMNELNIIISINYISKAVYDFQFLEGKMKSTLSSLIKHLKK
jgi:ribonuclease P protein component